MAELDKAIEEVFGRGTSYSPPDRGDGFLETYVGLRKFRLTDDGTLYFVVAKGTPIRSRDAKGNPTTAYTSKFVPIHGPKFAVRAKALGKAADQADRRGYTAKAAQLRAQAVQILETTPMQRLTEAEK